MRALREQDFESMASRVVDRFMSGDKLANVATQEAMSNELNPDQIERLVEAANTMAFLRLMEQQRAHAATQGPDMTHEFDPIDARQIIQQIIGQTPTMGGAEGMPDMEGMEGEERGDDDNGPLPDERPKTVPAPSVDADNDGKTDDDEDGDDDDNDGPFPVGSKDKKKSKKKAPPAFAKKDTEKEAAFRQRRQQKLAAILQDQYLQLELEFEDEFNKLGSLLRRAHGAPSAQEFEKDALVLDESPVGLVVLNMVKAAMHWPEISDDDAHVKHAALADRHVVTESETTRSYERLVKIATEATRLRSGAEFLRAQCS